MSRANATVTSENTGPLVLGILPCLRPQTQPKESLDFKLNMPVIGRRSQPTGAVAEASVWQ